MALHIQMSEEAEAELRRNALRNKLSSFLACLLFMAMGGGILFFTAVFIVGDTPVSFLAYTPPSEDGPPSNNPTPRELVSRSAASSSTVAPSVIVATSAASVSMAPVEIDMSDGLALDTSLDLGLGMGEDLGEGMGAGGSGLGSGEGSGSALEGTFYDTKQTGSGRSRRLSKHATKLADGENKGFITYNQDVFFEIVSNFVSKGWNKSVLTRYFESEKKLYASNFYLPAGSDRYAPIAYQLGDSKKPPQNWVCQPGGWVVVYRGKVRAPKTGKFRFIGTGDDYVGVRFNRKLVLSAGYLCFSHYEAKKPRGGPKFHLSEKPQRDAFLKDIKAGRDAQHKGYELISSVPGMQHWTDGLGGLMAGAEFDVEEGKEYPIEIAVAELGGIGAMGGNFGFVLFIEDITNGKNSKAKAYDLFRTNFSEPSAEDINRMLEEANCLPIGGKDKIMNIPYLKDSPIWTVTSTKI